MIDVNAKIEELLYQLRDQLGVVAEKDADSVTSGLAEMEATLAAIREWNKTPR